MFICIYLFIHSYSFGRICFVWPVFFFFIYQFFCLFDSRHLFVCRYLFTYWYLIFFIRICWVEFVNICLYFISWYLFLLAFINLFDFRYLFLSVYLTIYLFTGILFIHIYSVEFLNLFVVINLSPFSFVSMYQFICLFDSRYLFCLFIISLCCMRHTSEVGSQKLQLHHFQLSCIQMTKLGLSFDASMFIFCCFFLN